MQNESRVKKTFLNIRINMIGYFAAIIISFFTRQIFLDRLGPEFIGLTTTINSLLGFLNLAELGIGTSIAYFLYKPVHDGNRQEIINLISIMGYLYRFIGTIILSAGVIFSLFLPYIFKETPFSLALIFYCFYAHLASSMLGYFVNYRASTIFGADQRQYLVNGYFQLTQFSQTLIQAACAIYVQSFTLFITIGLIFSLINCWILNWKFHKIYPWIKTNVSDGKILLKEHPEIFKYVKRIFVHNIGGFINTRVMPLIIYGYGSLTFVTLYGNYTLLNSKIQGLIGSMMGGSTASVGNLIAEGNKKRIYDCYKELFSIKFLFVCVALVCLSKLNSPFIAVWLGSKYVLEPILVYLIIADFGLNILRDTTNQFLNGYGLYADVWVPIVRVASLGIIVIAASIWGITGALSIPVIVQIVLMHIWKPYYLYSEGLHQKFSTYFILVIRNLIPIIAAAIVANKISQSIYPLEGQPSTWTQFIKETFSFAIPMAVLALIFSYICCDGVRMFARRMKGIMMKRFKNR